VTIGVTARGLARNDRVSLACLLILSYNVHIDVYTFFHLNPLPRNHTTSEYLFPFVTSSTQCCI